MNIKQYITQLERKHNITVVYLTKSGSTLYGTNGPDSDVDYKGIFIPNKQDVLLKRDIPYVTYTTGNKDSKNTADDIDIHLDSIHTFTRLTAKGETGALDLLFSMFTDKVVLQRLDFVMAVTDNYTKFYGRNLQAFIGYAIGQTKKYNIKGARYNELVRLNRYLKYTTDLTLPMKDIGLINHLAEEDYKFISIVSAAGARGSKGNIMIDYLQVFDKKFDLNLPISNVAKKLKHMEDQFGNRAKAAVDNIDYKSLSHAVRVVLEVTELLNTNRIQFPLQYAEMLKKVKAGNVPLEECTQLIETHVVMADRMMASDTCLVTATADQAFLDNFILEQLG